VRFRGEVVGGPKVIRGGQGGQGGQGSQGYAESSTPADESTGSRGRLVLPRDSFDDDDLATRVSALTHDRDHERTGFLSLPYELRLLIYELLLLSEHEIYISPRRRQIRARIGTRPAANATYFSRGRPAMPSKYLEAAEEETRVHVEILRTCSMVNAEGTRLLYGKNRFVVGRKPSPAQPSLAQVL
jgi:hypothetical protein